MHQMTCRIFTELRIIYALLTAQKMKFSITDFFVAFTEEILNGKLHFLCSVLSVVWVYSMLLEQVQSIKLRFIYYLFFMSLKWDRLQLHICMMELFAKALNGFQPLTIFAN